MSEIPDYSLALAQLRQFLSDNNHPDSVLWVFRDDFWQLSNERALIRYPPHRDNSSLAQKVFEEGRIRGLIHISACAVVGHRTAATIWYPKYPGEEVQGWDCGLRLSIVDPLPSATAVPPLKWRFYSLLPSFKRYQRLAAFGGTFGGTRKWASS